MVVNGGSGHEAGQSIIEFIFMFPALLGLTALLYKVNAAMQMSIVDQQYARGQALFLTHNSPVYPEIRIRSREITAKKANLMVIGVSDNQATLEGFQPEASQQRISRNEKAAGPKPGAGESPAENGFPRIMNTVTLCTQSVTIGNGGDRVMSEIAANDSPKNFRFCQGLFDE